MPAVARVAPRLIVARGSTNVAELDLIMPVASFGREPANTMVLQDQRVSRLHARLSWTEQGWLLEDLQSRNGTYVNGERIASRLLRNGDQIQLGSTVMHFFAAGG
jgi:two-component system, NtrC family, sensor kinase